MGSFKLRVVAPCQAPWEAMEGDDDERHCARCSRTVHNLSAMREAEARRLLAGSDDRLCVRFLSRRDGTVVCRPHGGWIGRVGRALAVAALAIGFWTAVVLVQRPWRALARRLAGVPPPAPPPTRTREEDVGPRYDAEALNKLILESAMRDYGGAAWSMGEVPPGAGRFPPLLPRSTTKHRRPK